MISSVQASSSLQVPQQSMLLAAQGRKPGSLPKPGMPAGLGHIRETLPMPFILQAPEEQTDNWDDDFEEGISLTKLHGARSPPLRRRWAGSTDTNVALFSLSLCSAGQDSG